MPGEEGSGGNGMRFDCRNNDPVPYGGCKVYDADTGEYIPSVFLVDTDTTEVGRHDLDADGVPQVTPDGQDVRRIFERRRVRLEPLVSPDVVVQR